jgi:hypothetical protein
LLKCLMTQKRGGINKMNFADHYLAQSLHYATSAKSELSNLAHADMMGKAMDIVKQVIADRKREQEITGVNR